MDTRAAARADDEVVQALVLRQVGERPDAVALVAGRRHVSYRQLWHRALAVALRLKQLGVGPETRVAVAMERSAALIETLLGILLAGGAYVPLTPSDPLTRRAGLLDDIFADDPGDIVDPGDANAVRVLVTHRGQWTAPDELDCLTSRGIERLDVETLPHLAADANLDELAAKLPRVDDRNLVYVVFTSGSTGRPKGVEAVHRAVVRLVRDGDFADFAPETVLVQVAPVAFDASTLEIWATLAGGGRLVIPRRARFSLSELARLIRRHAATVQWITTGFFHQMVDAEVETLRRLGQVLTGGEVLSPGHVGRLLSAGGDANGFAGQMPHFRVTNFYGPTENTTFTTYYLLHDADFDMVASPIGKAIARTYVRVLASPWEQAADGEPGELACGGDGLARGYLGRPARTAASFVPDPWSETPGARLYRSGDLVRQRSDGVVEFLGRLDAQVKVRGFRIEPGEVEAALRALPAVGDAIVVARRDGTEAGGSSSLVAYIVPAAELPERDTSPAVERPERDTAEQKVAEENTAEENTAEPSTATDGAGVPADHLDHWQRLFDDIYAADRDLEDIAFDRVGWDSNYTGQSIPREEMQEWLRGTLDDLQQLQPKRVLEVGCGTGMVLFGVAGVCDRYVGIDLSPQVVADLQQRVAAARARAKESGDRLAEVELHCSAAHDASAWRHQRFDTTVLNSVLQYFPDMDYLAGVVQNMISVTEDGGAVYVGDVRSFPLLELCNTSLALFRAADDLPLAALQHEVRRRTLQENELTVDPAFFFELARRDPRVTAVEIHVPQGRAHNELTRFRYSAVLRIGPASGSFGGRDTPWQDATWQDGRGLTHLDALRRELEAARRDGVSTLALRGLPNARLAPDVAARRRLDELLAAGEHEELRLARAGELRRAVADVAGLEPLDVRELGAELGFLVFLGWSQQEDEGRFEALFDATGTATACPPLPEAVASEALAPESGSASWSCFGWSRFGNDAHRGERIRELVPELRSALVGRLPEHMVPSSLVLLDELPLKPNGKVDTARLPQPEVVTRAAQLTPPRTALEQALAELWCELLHLDEVGIHERFADLGGHSLLATRLLARIRELTGVALPLGRLFELPTIAQLASEVEAEGGSLSASAASAPLQAAGPDQPAPLSFGQEQLWFLARLVPDNPFYNVPLVLKLSGSIDVVALQAALGGLLRRHEVLRAEIRVDDSGESEQQAITWPPRGRAGSRPERTALSLPVIDLGRLTEDVDTTKVAEEVDRLQQREALRPLDLTPPPLLRAALARWGKHARLWLTVHHIAIDGRSLHVLLDELAALYRAARTGHAARLAPLPVQYGDFARWQRRMFGVDKPGVADTVEADRSRADRLRKGVDAWRRHLQAAPEVLELPVDRPVPAVPTFRAQLRQVQLSRRQQARLQEFADATDASLYMALFAITAAWLRRHGAARDLVLGTPLGGRPHPQLEPLIGFFVQSLPVRLDAPLDLGFDRLLARVRRALLDTWALPEVPFEKLVEELQPARQPGQNPLLQAVVGFNQPLPAPDLGHADVETTPAYLELRTTRFDLEVHFEPQLTDGVIGLLVASEDRFEAATAERLAMHWQRLMDAVLERPDVPLWQLDMLAGAERQQLLYAWAGGAEAPRDARLEASLEQLFLRAADRLPDAVALTQGRRHHSYRGVRAAAGRVAGWLRQPVVQQQDADGGEARVVVSLPRSPEQIVAVLGVLLVGGVYVPLDPDDPAPRRRQLLEELRPAAVIDVESCPPGVFSGSPPYPEEAQPRMPEPRPGGDRLAYVFFTSGSSGVPKGVAVPHRAVARLVLTADYVRLGPEQVMLQAAPLSFDASTFELWGALAWGGRLVLMPPGRPSLQALDRQLQRQSVSVVFLTTSLFNQLVDLGVTLEAGAGLDRVAQVLTGGEAMSAVHARRLVQRDFRGLLSNVYGPTENTTFSTTEPITSGAPVATISIGRPISHTLVRVLGPHAELVGIGVGGQLALAGAGLARGYLDRPAFTAASFVPDAFATRAAAGSRLYLTGDLVRWRADGRLDFLGRLDHQFKVRGFRIEPAEVEAALMAHPDVLAAAALALSGATAGDRRLVASVVTHPSAGGDTTEIDTTEVDTVELRHWLARRLPAYLVPSLLLVLPNLPLNATGKLDRRALQRLVRDRLAAGTDEAATSAVTPRTPMEQLLARIWVDLLGPAAGEDIHASFFDLGGHSLLATQVITRVLRYTGVELPLADIFARPTVAELARAVEQHLAGGQPSIDADQPPSAQCGPPPYQAPLSFAQRRLWFLSRLVPDSTVYNVPQVLELEAQTEDDSALAGPTIAAIGQALHAIAARHDVLRTGFLEPDEAEPEPRQYVVPARGSADASATEFPVYLDLSALPPTDAAAEATDLRWREARRPFDLARPCPWRALLLRLDARYHHLLLTLHHIATDGWSSDLLLRELSLRVRGMALPPLQLQYADFARWQRGRVASGALDADLAWWRQHLESAPTLLELPTDRPRPSHPSYQGRQLESRLHTTTVEALEVLGRRQGATLFMVLGTLFQVLLWRLSGRRDLVLGSPIAGREQLELENLLGCFVNTLVLRTEISSELTLEQQLARSRATCLEAYARATVPFELLVESLQLERHLSHQPLVQIALGVQPAVAPPKLPGLRVRRSWSGLDVARFDLTVSVDLLSADESTDGVRARAWWEYSSDLFDAVTMRRWSRLWHRLLVAWADDPTFGRRQLVDLPWLDPAERHQLLHAWAVANADTDAPRPVAPRVAAVAAEWPHTVAVVWQASVRGLTYHLSYGELGRRAWAVAGELRRQGVGADVPVGLCTGRGAEAVVGALAVLWAGGAYLPLDPAHPRRRLCDQLHDAGAPLVLVSAAGARTLGDGHRSLSLQPLPSRLLEQAAAVDPARDLRCPPPLPFQGAYVLYTSGSTGRPKGSITSHGNLSHLVAAVQGGQPVVAGERYLQAAGPAFDATVWELWPRLTRGLTLCVPPPEIISSPPELVAWIQRQRPTDGFLPTPLAQAVAAEPAACALPVRQLATGGTRLLPVTRTDLPWRLLNIYGPSECTVVVATAAVRYGHAELPAIGRPLPGIDLQVLDRRLRPLPAGVPGQLCAAGAGVSRGYLRRPALTAASFRPHPGRGDAVADRPGERVYLTGDLVRWRGDGYLDFLGRIDHQIQLQGRRIELGEIEAVLLRQPEVREVVVQPQGSEPAVHLVAYLVATPSTELAEPADLSARLRQALMRDLPDYMVPAVIRIVDALPRNTSGKIDRSRLPALDEPDSLAEPQGALEQLIADLWREVLSDGVLGDGALGDAVLGRQQNFFLLGGHSLLAARLRARLSQRLRVDLPVRLLFEAPTIAEQARWVEDLRAREAGGEGSGEIPLQAADEPGPAPLSLGQERLWLLQRMEPQLPVYNMPMTLDLPALSGDRRVALRQALSTLTRRHEVLRTVYAPPRGDQLEPVQHVRSPVPIVPPYVDLGSLSVATADREAERLGRREARLPFDLEQGPLARYVLLGLPGRHQLLLNLHHSIADGWSLDLLTRELASLYRAPATALPELPLQYGDFARWQRQRLAGGDLAAHLRWWCQHLQGVPPVLELPLDHPRPPLLSYRGALRELRLDPAPLAALATLGRGLGATRFMTLLAAFQALLARLSGRRDIVVGTPVAARTQPQLEGMIGFFVNNLVLRADCAPGLSFEQLLRRVRDTCLDALVHQEVPFERLVEELQPERSTAWTPLFQVAFVVQDSVPSRIPWAASATEGGATAVLRERDLGAAKFDLALTLPETVISTDGAGPSPSPGPGPGAGAGAGAGAGTAAIGSIEYNPDLFDAVTIQRWAGHLGYWLAALAAQPELALAHQSLLSAAERHQLRAEWSAPWPLPELAGEAAARGLHAGLPAHERFRAHAAAAPEVPAVVEADGSWNYRQLDDLSGRVAAHLLFLGVRNEDRVALCLPRGRRSVLALVATLRAGGCFLSLDPEHPIDRLRFQVADAGTRVLLIDPELPAAADLAAAVEALPQPPRLLRLPPLPELNELAEFAELEKEPLGGDWPAILGRAPLAIEPPVEPPVADEQLAYICYTSGSTGRPKGVAVRHHGLRCLLDAFHPLPSFQPGERIGHAAGLAFDVTIFEVWLGLGGGVTLCVPPELTRASAPAMLEWMVAERLDACFLATPIAEAVLAELARDETGIADRLRLRVLYTGGDRLLHRPSPALPWPLINLYGPTENTVIATRGQVTPGPGGPPSLGRPLPGVLARLLDPQGQMLPAGVPGHAHLGGDLLVRGYLGRPELTAAAFVPDPFSQQAGARLYRTGDLMRWLPDGRLAFLGRIDHQVKLRGYRIELAEIESTLDRHPEIQQSVVLLRGSNGNSHLAAYLVPESGTSPAVDELRAFLAETLPAYMVPAHFRNLDALPVNRNGKVDREALARLVPSVPRKQRVAARTDLERTLAELWSHVLGLEQVGVYDNFFDLGGHSLLLARLQAKLQEKLGQPVEMMDLFRFTTIHQLARHLDASADSTASTREAQASTRDRAAGRRAAARAAASRRGAQR